MMKGTVKFNKTDDGCSTPKATGYINILEELYGDSWRTPSILSNKKIQEELKIREQQKSKKNVKMKLDYKKESAVNNKNTTNSLIDNEDFMLKRVNTNIQKTESNKTELALIKHNNDEFESSSYRDRPRSRISSSDSSMEIIDSSINIDAPIINISESNSDDKSSKTDDEQDKISKNLLNKSKKVRRRHLFSNTRALEAMEISSQDTDSNSTKDKYETPKNRRKVKSKLNDSFINDSSESDSSSDSFANTPAFYNRVDSVTKKSAAKTSTSISTVLKKNRNVLKLPDALINLCDSESESDENGDDLLSATICDIREDDDDLDSLSDGFNVIRITDDDKKIIRKDRTKKPSECVIKNLFKEKTKNIYERTKGKKLSFLESLSENIDENSRHPDALPFIKNFKKTKEQLAGKLFTLYNREVFGDRLDKNMEITWCKQLRTTAGLCKPKSHLVNGERRYMCSVRLSVKVIDRPARLRDTLIHELCHVANFVIDNVKNAKHGLQWKYWTKKAEKAFPELPKIGVKHNYIIEHNFMYICGYCSSRVYRHKNTLSSNESCRCGRASYTCYKRQPGGSYAPVSHKAPSAFALFVKENYSTVKTPMRNHKDCMTELSRLYNERKVTSLL